MCTRTHTVSVMRTTSPSPFGFTSDVTKSLSDKNSHLPSIEYQLFKITQKTARMLQMGKAPDYVLEDAAAAAKSLQSCPTLCNPIDGSPPGSPVPGILQARTLEWVAISFSSARKWKVKVKSLSRVWPLATPWTAAHQAPPSMGFSRQQYWSGVPLPFPIRRWEDLDSGLALLFISWSALVEPLTLFEAVLSLWNLSVHLLLS